MMNFFLGTAAGALVAGVLTIAAARQPEYQAKMGLFPPPPQAATVIARPAEPDCKTPPPRTSSVGNSQEILFNRRRFWSVAP